MAIKNQVKAIFETLFLEKKTQEEIDAEIARALAEGGDEDDESFAKKLQEYIKRAKSN
jgi:hypothetical protein